MNILSEQEIKIPLPQIDQQLEAKINGEINSTKFMELGRNMLPNIGQVSLLNSQADVNCATVSDSGAVMAVGMATSVVKVFLLAKSKLDVVEIDDVIRRQVS